MNADRSVCKVNGVGPGNTVRSSILHNVLPGGIGITYPAPLLQFFTYGRLVVDGSVSLGDAVLSRQVFTHAGHLETEPAAVRIDRVGKSTYIRTNALHIVCHLIDSFMCLILAHAALDVACLTVLGSLLAVYCSIYRPSSR